LVMLTTGADEKAQHDVAPKAQYLRLLRRLGYVEMGDEKTGFADWNTTAFTDGSTSMSATSASSSTIVAGTNS